MKRTLLVTLALVTLVAGLAYAYGPSTHMREADHFLTMTELHPQDGMTRDPDFLRRHRQYLLLGAIWPDVARVITEQDAGKVDENSVDPHNRHFVSWYLEQMLDQYPDDPWMVAFAVGNHVHCAGDATAQDSLTQHMAVRWKFGELDLLTGTMDDHPGGENEAVLEGGMEIMLPAFDYYLELVDTFLTSPGGLAALTELVGNYLDHYETYFAVEASMDRETAVARVREAFVDFPHRFPPCDRQAHPGVLAWARAGFTPEAALAKGFDTDELLRAIGNGLLDGDMWALYFTEGFFDLTATMMLDFQEGQGYFDWFPNWSAQAMRSGAIQSLAAYLPGQMVVEDGRFLFGLAWYENDSMVPVTSIDATSPPATVTLAVTYFDTLGRTSSSDALFMRVREDSDDQTLIDADIFEEVNIDPWTYDVNGPVTLQLTFDPSPAIAASATGIVAEIGPGDNNTGLPFLSTDWSVYEQIDEIDMTKDAYSFNYSTYGHWPHSLRIVYPAKEVRP
jgi:hypothetical protein